MTEILDFTTQPLSPPLRGSEWRKPPISVEKANTGGSRRTAH
jgi:hypothetical protein